MSLTFALIVTFAALAIGMCAVLAADRLEGRRRLVAPTLKGRRGLGAGSTKRPARPRFDRRLLFAAPVLAAAAMLWLGAPATIRLARSTQGSVAATTGAASEPLLAVNDAVDGPVSPPSGGPVNTAMAEPAPETGDRPADPLAAVAVNDALNPPVNEPAVRSGGTPSAQPVIRAGILEPVAVEAETVGGAASTEILPSPPGADAGAAAAGGSGTPPIAETAAPIITPVPVVPVSPVPAPLLKIVVSSGTPVPVPVLGAKQPKPPKSERSSGR